MHFTKISENGYIAFWNETLHNHCTLRNLLEVARGYCLLTGHHPGGSCCNRAGWNVWSALGGQGASTAPLLHWWLLESGLKRESATTWLLGSGRSGEQSSDTWLLRPGLGSERAWRLLVTSLGSLCTTTGWLLWPGLSRALGYDRGTSSPVLLQQPLVELDDRGRVVVARPCWADLLESNFQEQTENATSRIELVSMFHTHTYTQTHTYFI
jgi:hypothetical protein